MAGHHVPPSLFVSSMELITRKEAIAQGLRYYYTGVPCPKQHVSKRKVSNKNCFDCGMKTGLKRKSSLALAEAKEQGKLRYFTGTPCHKGHASNRWTHDRSCVECNPNELTKLYSMQNKAESINSGLMVYEGIACANCGSTRRLVSNSRCTVCNSMDALAWARNNPEKYRAIHAKRRASKLKATPPWVDFKLIQDVYIKCPKGLEVDHIIPLQGKNVRGLHVPWNLQYLTRAENAHKSNKWVN
jgi:hypothetical protein